VTSWSEYRSEFRPNIRTTPTAVATTEVTGSNVSGPIYAKSRLGIYMKMVPSLEGA
jgi:hypothetical protein